MPVHEIHQLLTNACAYSCRSGRYLVAKYVESPMKMLGAKGMSQFFPSYEMIIPAQQNWLLKMRIS